MPRTSIAALLLSWCFLTSGLHAQNTTPNLRIDASSTHPISPDIYGINYYWNGATINDPAAAAIRATARRWGGNNTSTYHWKLDVNSIDADWFFEVLPDSSVNASLLPEGSTFNRFADMALRTGGSTLVTVPVLGWLPKARREACSFDVALYGKQCKQDPYAKYHPYTCGNGIAYDNACGDPSTLDGKSPSSPVYIKNDPADVYAQFSPDLQTEWVTYLVSRYGASNRGGMRIYELGNEPIWWDNTHRDIHPDPYTYDELLTRNLAYAKAIKQGDPTALVAGPVSDNWASLFLSKLDIVKGQASGRYWGNPVDRQAHGNLPIMSWYLQQFRDYEQKNGVRLLDYLDVHAYLPTPSGTSASENTQRLNATREFWDPTYVVSGDYWIKDVDKNGAAIAPQFIPRVRKMIADNYPGTKLAITEYDPGAQNTLNGALAQADLLGIFGREGVDLATFWGPPKATAPGAFAFRIYRNYDGAGAAFGDTGLDAQSEDQGKLSIYAATRTDQVLTALVINKTGSALPANLSLANFTHGDKARVFQYTGDNLAAIVRAADAPVSNGALAYTYPPNSITLLEISPAPANAAKPVITAAANAASYAAQAAPGSILVLWGTDLGPQKLVTGAAPDGQFVSTTAGGVRVLFDGVPAPMVYASAQQLSAIVPYAGATGPVTHVVVEYQGVRSEPFPLTVVATDPGLFTSNASGSGQAAASNEDLSVNSQANPAQSGKVIVLWATGEGLTDPPGVDGRLAQGILPKPLAPVTVTIGGQKAVVQYAGAAPGNMPGLLQINATIPSGVAGAAVPVKVQIGAKQSQDGVSIAVR